MSGLNCLRKADVLIHVLREYVDSNVCHYEGSVDPVRDLLTVNQELLIYVSVFAVYPVLKFTWF